MLNKIEKEEILLDWFVKNIGKAFYKPKGNFNLLMILSKQLMLKKITTILLLISFSQAGAQVFEDHDIQVMVRKSMSHIYNASEDSAFYYINKVEKELPKHPVVPLMRAMTLLWANIPTITGQLFLEMENYLNHAVAIAEEIDPDLEDPEMIFFSMASYGLLAEYYADQGYNIKAVGEAGRAYSLMKKGFDIVEEHPEFLLTTGLYNYFREKYPEKHPVYKPLVWFFRSGDIELGLKQLQKACNPSNISHVEAYVYLSYIYLRYEYKPEKAQYYLRKLINLYPDNYYAKAKYLESLANPYDFTNASEEMIYSLIQNKNVYYKLAGYVFLGYYEEFVHGSMPLAESAYRKGLAYGEQIPHHGEYFKSLGYLRLGKILLENGNNDEAEKILKLSMDYAETKQIKQEAKTLLSRI